MAARSVRQVARSPLVAVNFVALGEKAVWFIAESGERSSLLDARVSTGCSGVDAQQLRVVAGLLIHTPVPQQRLLVASLALFIISVVGVPKQIDVHDSTLRAVSEYQNRLSRSIARPAVKWGT